MNIVLRKRVKIGFLYALIFIVSCTFTVYYPDVAKAGSSGVSEDGPRYSIEAESPDNSLTGKAGVVSCGVCSGSAKVGNLYLGSALQFNNVNVQGAGVYKMSVFYISGDSRPFTVSVNGGEREPFSPPATADWNTVGIFNMEVRLRAGNNTISFDDAGGYAPDIDKIDLTLVTLSDPGTGTGDDGEQELGTPVETVNYGPIQMTRYTKGVSVANPKIKLIYNTETGLSSYVGNGKAKIKGVYSSVQTDRYMTSKDYSTHEFARNEVAPFEDRSGKGVRITVINKQNGLPTLKQIFYIYEQNDYLLTQTTVENTVPVSAGYIAPIIVDNQGGVDIGNYGDNRVLIAPFDNDMWSRYQSKTINTDLNNSNYESSELTAIYDNDSRNGFVIGSVSHDTWKTGIYWNGSNNRLNKLNVYGGFSSQTSTHDILPHGKVTGTAISSPKVFVGYYPDYRDGLEAYGQANAAEAPPLKFGKNVPQGVPVGWNSWGAFDSKLSYEKAVDTSNYFKEHLQGASFNNKGNVYINLDSYWDNMSDEQLGKLVGIIHANGQKAGIYYSPFVYWGNNMSQTVEGTGGKYTYGDIVLRDEQGNPLPPVDGAYAVDLTHPGTKQKIDYYMNRFKKLGFEFIKLDFLSHGSFEGHHYDPQVFTGIQAYNQGMAYIDKVLDDSMFISESIAPLFPSQYAHSRRISCDVDGSLNSTEYQLNNSTYGWWQNGTIYRYTDPDYMSLVKGGSLLAAQTRVNAAAISGTVFLNSDDVSNPVAREYMEKLLTRPSVNELATKGKAFRPLEGNTGTGASDTFILKEGDVYYAALFNYSNSTVDRVLDFNRAGIDTDSQGCFGYKVTDLWSGATESRVNKQLRVTLQGAESKLLKITFVKSGVN